MINYHTLYTGKEYLYKCIKMGIQRVAVWRMLFKTDFLRKNGLYFKKGIFHEDVEFSPRAYLVADHLSLIPDVFYVYDNTRPNSITNSTEKKYKRAADIINICDSHLPLYMSVEPKELRDLLIDTVSCKYMTTVMKYELHKNPDFKIRRFYPLKYAHKLKSRIKALVFAVSPSLFCKIFANISK